MARPVTDRGPRSGSSWWLVSLTLFFFAGSEAPAQITSAREYQIKAAFLFNFSQFVEWPPNAFTSPQAPLVIGVLGNDPFGPFLDEAVRGEKSQGRPIVIERCSDPEEACRCHILFVNYPESERLDTALKALNGRSILTVGDTAGFARRGGMIRFITVNNKVRLRVNLDAAKAAGLTLSSKLLRPAEVVTSTQE